MEVWLLVGFVVLVQGSFIAWLLIQRTRRARAESALRDSEERFRLMTECAPVMIWTTRPDTTLDYINATGMEFSGLPIEKLLGTGWLDAVHPDDVDHCIRTYTPAFEACMPFRMEYRVRHADGAYRWVLDTGVPKYGPEGFTGYVGCTVDITDRKGSEQAISESEAILQATNRQIQDLAGRLIASQEAERARIARELHDDLSQQLAGLSIALSGLKRHVAALPGASGLDGEVAALQERAITVAENLRHVSHNLHPTALEHSGLVAALSSLCEDLEQRHGVVVSFQSQGSVTAADRDTALCLYRVAQEALRNVITHADARRAQVVLVGADDRIELTITDDGKGFNVATTRDSRRGLGLVSMNERVRLAGGTVSVVTETNRGTTVHVLLARRQSAA